MKSTSLYNIIIDNHDFNALGVVLSTLYLKIKYHLDNRWVGVVKCDKEVARKCRDNLKIKRRWKETSSHHAIGSNVFDLDPRVYSLEDGFGLMEKLKTI